MAADMGRRRKTNNKKRPSQSQKKKQRPNVNKKYTCTQKPLQAKCITVMVRSLKTLKTKINGHVVRNCFDIFEPR